MPSLDEKVDEIFADEDDVPAAERAKSKWAALEAIMGAEPRLKQVAEDLVAHHEQRCRTQPGKAMVVAMGRDITPASMMPSLPCAPVGMTPVTGRAPSRW
ncbi:MAG: hypothetical protein F4Y87_07730 [Synechococcus sp. SB0665_bin_28]|nr:hypothetical protein [Synechococcus sp. SB0665_bin_28]MYF20414.1 hypothetical protein [Synechococcus sp. SB0677_bin_5]